jgi:hypothetical protein
MSSSLDTALGTTNYRREDYARARALYKPRSIDVLLVAESPPSSGGFFYFTQTIGKDHLFRETMKALELWPLRRPMRKNLDKTRLLEEFSSKLFFLIDTCDTPVDRLSPKARMMWIAQEAPGLARRVKALDPDSIVIVKKTVYRPVRHALETVGLGDRILNTKPLPFPSHGNQRRYRLILRRVLRRRSHVAGSAD